MTTRAAQTMKATKPDPRPLSPRPFLSRARSKPRPIQRVLNLYEPDPAPSTLNALKPTHLYDINCAMPFRMLETDPTSGAASEPPATSTVPGPQRPLPAASHSSYDVPPAEIRGAIEEQLPSFSFPDRGDDFLGFVITPPGPKPAPVRAPISAWSKPLSSSRLNPSAATYNPSNPRTFGSPSPRTSDAESSRPPSSASSSPPSSRGSGGSKGKIDRTLQPQFESEWTTSVPTAPQTSRGRRTQPTVESNWVTRDMVYAREKHAEILAGARDGEDPYGGW